MSDVRNVPTISIIPGPRPRAVPNAALEELALSINTSGSIHPIVVRPVVSSDTEKYEIVAGLQRFRAMSELLKYEEVLCSVRNLSDDEAELLEIDENLLRVSLTPVEQARQLSRAHELRIQLFPATRAGVAGGLSRHHGRDANDKLSFAEEIGNRMHVSPRTIQRQIVRGGAITDADVRKIAGTSLDSGVELDALIEQPPELKASLIERAAAGERVSARVIASISAPNEDPILVPSDLSLKLDEMIFRCCTEHLEGLGANVEPVPWLEDAIIRARVRSVPPELLTDVAIYAGHKLAMGLLALLSPSAAHGTRAAEHQLSMFN